MIILQFITKKVRKIKIKNKIKIHKIVKHHKLRWMMKKMKSGIKNKNNKIISTYFDL